MFHDESAKTVLRLLGRHPQSEWLTLSAVAGMSVLDSERARSALKVLGRHHQVEKLEQAREGRRLEPVFRITAKGRSALRAA